MSPRLLLLPLGFFLVGFLIGFMGALSANPSKPKIQWEQKDVPCVDGEFGTYGFYLETSKGNTRRWTIALKCANGEAAFNISERKL